MLASYRSTVRSRKLGLMDLLSERRNAAKIVKDQEKSRFDQKYSEISSTVHVHNQSVGIIFVNISSTVASTSLRLHINKDNMFLNKYTKIHGVS